MRFNNLSQSKSILTNFSFFKIENNLSDEDIIYLQNNFLQKGFHLLEAKNVNESSSFISKIVKSLNCYKNIAYFSYQTLENSEYFDLYNYLISNNITEEKSLLCFFMMEFNFDFLYIEISDELLEASWYKLFEKFMLDFQINTLIPIVIIS